MALAVIMASLGLTGCGTMKPPSKILNAPETFRSEPIPPTLATRMPGLSWHPGCPVPIESLRLLRVKYLGFDGAEHEGQIVVHAKLADEVLEIFREIFEAGFPIARMQTIEDFGGSDELSMAANNSSGFNCRANATTGQGYSKHSYGFAVDINPIQNPYAKPQVDISGKLLHPIDDALEPPRVEPEAGRAFLDRREPKPGMIIKGDAVYRAFTRRGWTWGGDFEGRTDYQHFETWLDDY
jgi:hypothetical protein